MRDNVNKYIPKWAKIMLLLGGISWLVLFVAKRNTAFAEWISSGIGYYIRMFLGRLSSLVPFSVGEVLIVLSPLILIIILVVAFKRGSFKGMIRFLSGILAMLSLFYTAYVLALGVSYHREPLGNRLDIDNVKVNADNLYSTALILKGECEALLDEIAFGENGSSESDVDFDVFSQEAIKGYERLNTDYPSLNIKSFESVAKPVHFSEVMTALDLLGVYTFFTGESNVNVHYPDYEIPFTVAHEMAHQRGIARENEANFTAFLVCVRADSAYVRYSGYMNMLEYVASALNKTDKQLYRDLVSSYDARMKGEITARREFYQNNKNEFLGNLSNKVNDNYLKAQGTEGVVSYGLVVRLCVSYYADKSN